MATTFPLPALTDAEKLQVEVNAAAQPPTPVLLASVAGLGGTIAYTTYISYVLHDGVATDGVYTESVVSPPGTIPDSTHRTIQSPPAPTLPAVAYGYNVYANSNLSGPQLINAAPVLLGTDYTLPYDAYHDAEGGGRTVPTEAQMILMPLATDGGVTQNTSSQTYTGSVGGGGGSIGGLSIGNGYGLSWNPLTGTGVPPLGQTDFGGIAALPDSGGATIIGATIVWYGLAKKGPTRLGIPNDNFCDNAPYVPGEPRGLLAHDNIEIAVLTPATDTLEAYSTGLDSSQVAAMNADPSWPAGLKGYLWFQQPSSLVFHCGTDNGGDISDIEIIEDLHLEVIYRVSEALGGETGPGIFPVPPPPPPPPQLLPYLFIPKGQGQSIDELEGHSSIAQINVETVDVRGELKLLAADPTAIGRIAKIKMGFPGMCLGDFVTLHTTKVTEINWTETGRMEFIIQDVQRYMDDKYIFISGGPELYVIGQTTANEPPAGDAWNGNSLTIDDKNIRWIFGNPMDIYLAVLQNECGVGQANQGDPASWQIYTPGNDATIINPNPYIDVPRILALRDGEMSGVRFEFKFTRPVQAKNWLDDQILKPIGLYTVVRSNGLLYLKSMKSPESVTAAIPINQQNILGIPRIERLPIVNYVTFRLDVDDSVRETAARQYQQEFDFEEPISLARYNQYFEQDIESTGMKVNYGGFNLAYLQAQRIFSRHAFATPKYTFSTWLKYVPVELGDFFLLTHPLLLDLKVGTLGVTDVLCEVINRDPDYAQGKMTFDVLDTRFMSLSEPHYIAPVAGGVPAYTSATDQQKAHYFFITGTGGTYSNGDPGDEIF